MGASEPELEIHLILPLSMTFILSVLSSLVVTFVPLVSSLVAVLDPLRQFQYRF